MAARVPVQSQEERVQVPPVDIYETAEGIVLMADLPGVSARTLEIRVEQEVLTIEGSLDLEMPEELKPLYAEVQASRYRRRFTLSPELDTDKIEARLSQGVLTLSIPKREELRPKKIEVKVVE